MTGARSSTPKQRARRIAPDPDVVREAAEYLERGTHGADYIAYRVSREIIRLAGLASREPA